MNNAKIIEAEKKFGLGKYNEAISILEKYRSSNNERALNILARSYNAIKKQKKALEIIEQYKKTPSKNEDIKARWISLESVSLHGLGEIEKSRKMIEEGVIAYPNFVEFHHNLCVMYATDGSWDKALEHGKIANKLQSKNSEILSQVGRALIGLKDTVEAKKIFKELIELFPNKAEGYSGYGAACLLDYEIEEAIRYIKKTLEISPRYSTAYGNLGVAYKLSGQYQDAMDAFGRAIEIDPEDTEHRWNLGLLKLLTGDFKTGWELYEWRYNPKRAVIDRVILPNVNVPMLKDGDSVKDKTIALMVEQGFGDSIQFIRYAKNLREEGANVVVITPEPLMGLMQGLPWANYVTNRWSNCPPLDYWTYPMSMPRRYRTDLDTVPKIIPYLFARESNVEKWKNRIGQKKTKLRVGLVWAGRPGHGNDINRSMRLVDFTPLRNEDVEYISLQTGERANDEIPNGMKMQKLGGEISNFSDTAAILSQLDLLITIDSAPAHLAGAIGCPVWVLLPSNPDFRWMLDRDDSPWYDKSMRLFRQKKPREWSEVIENISQALTKLILTPEHRKTIALPDIPLSVDILNEAGAMPLLRIAIDLQQKKRGNVAANIYNFILQYSPWETDAVRNLAVYMREIKKYEIAKKLNEECIRLHPNDKTAHANYANLLSDLNDIEKAEYHANKSIELDECQHSAWYIKSTVHQKRVEYADAQYAIDRAIGLQPNSPVYLTMKAIICTLENKLDAARAILERVEASNPSHLEMRIAMAQLLMEEGRFEDSEKYYSQLFREENLGDMKVEVLLCRSTLFSKTGKIKEAVEDLKKALEINPNDADAHHNLGMYQLMIGNLREGWREYEWRYHPERKSNDRVRMPDFYNPSKSGELWKGESLVGKKISIFAEQGHGDNIQFIRYSKKLKDLGADVYLICPVSLHELMESCDSVDLVCSEISKIPQSDYSIYPMSLAFLLKTDEIEDIPATVPYLSVKKNKLEKWKKILIDGGYLKKPMVVLINRGTPMHGNDKNRSIPLEHFEKIIKNEKYSFVIIDHLSKDQEFINCGSVRLPNLSFNIDDFEDLAAVLSCANLTISVDSAPLHLAGALGKEAWGLIPFIHDWRWIAGRNDSPWYPTISLYRQRKAGDWQTTLSEVSSALIKEEPRFKS